MCKGEVLRFSCRHGLLMNIGTCKWPCPQLQVVNMKSIQPFKCYKCQHRLSTLSTTSSASDSSADASCASSFGSMDSMTSISSFGSASRPTSSSHKKNSSSCSSTSTIREPVHRKSSAVAQTCRKTNVTDRAFYFSCSSSAHYPSPHYATLPYFIAHQEHECPPCQIATVRNRSMREVVADAEATHPHLTAEMLVCDNRRQEIDIPSLEKYIDEKRKEEKQFWFCRIRKWEQDLKCKNVLVKEEDGLSLFGDQ